MRQGEDDDGLAPPQDPATRAFENLRAEVMVLRRAMEELPAALEGQRSPDYTTTLGQIARELAGVSERLALVERQPALKLTPAEHGRAIEMAGAGVMRDAAGKLHQATTAVDVDRRKLAQMIGTIRTQDKQRKWLIWTAVVGLVAGLVLFPLLGNILPISLSSRMAAITMGETNRWSVGRALIDAHHELD